MYKIDKISIIEQLTRSPSAEQRIKIFVAPGVTETCYQPAYCKGFSHPGDREECYPNHCPSTDICKRVGHEGLRWEYV